MTATVGTRRARRGWAWLVCLAAGSAQGQGPAAMALPPPALAHAVLAAAPAVAAAGQERAAAEALRRQAVLGEPAWVASLEGARRQVQAQAPSLSPAERSGEWQLALQRSVRLPGKAAAHERLGQARLAQAEAEFASAWRAQGRALLEAWTGWLAEEVAAQQWQRQQALLAQQAEQVARRQRAGAASALEMRQAEAAWVQVRVQATAALGRAQAARTALRGRFPGLQAALEGAAPALEPPVAAAAAPEALRAALVDADAEWRLAEREAEAAQAASLSEAAEQRPDPTLALRIGRARDGAERYLGFSVSLPFGSDARAAGSAAAAARARAAALRADDARRQAEVQAGQSLAALGLATAGWQGQAEAAQLLERSADGVARAWELGDGTLADVVAARRLAHEQALSAALAAVEAWRWHWRVNLDAGRLWAAPAEASTP